MTVVIVWHNAHFDPRAPKINWMLFCRFFFRGKVFDKTPPIFIPYVI